MHTFSSYADVRAALADPALVPVPPGPPGAIGTMAWLRSSVARFSTGEAHARRRAIVVADLARVDPDALRRAVETDALTPAVGPDALPPAVETDALRRTVETDARRPADRADAPRPAVETDALRRTVETDTPRPADGADALRRTVESRREALDVSRDGEPLEANRSEIREAGRPAAEAAVAEIRLAGAPPPETTNLEVRRAVVRALASALGIAAPDAVADAVTVASATYFGGSDEAADLAVDWLVRHLAEPDPERAANRIGLLIQACDATAILVTSARAMRGAALVESTVPLHGDAALVAPTVPLHGTAALVAPTRTVGRDADAAVDRALRDDQPVRVMRRVAARATRIGGADIAAGDVVELDVAAAGREAGEVLAFGASPRVCPGRDHAIAVAAGLTATPKA